MNDQKKTKAELTAELSALRRQIRDMEQSAAEHKQTEDDLRAVAAGWQATFDAVGSVIFLMDVNHRILRANRAVKDILGCDPGDFIGHLCHEVVHCTSHPIPGCPCFPMRQSKRRESTELNMGNRWLEVVTDPIMDDTGTLTGIVHIINDITTRKQAMESLRQQEEKLSSIFRAAPVGIGIVTDRVLTEFNDTFCRMTGYSREELSGKDTRMLYSSQEDYDAVGRESRRQIVGKSTGTIETYLKRKDGTVIDVLVSLTPLDSAYSEAGLTFTVMDITELKRVEAAIRASEEQLRLIAENAKAVIWMMDLNLQYTYMGPFIKHILDYTPEEYMAKPLQEVMTPSSLDICLRLFSEEIHKETIPDRDPFRSLTVEVEHIHRDGRPVPVEINMTFIRDEEGRATGILGISRDMSEQRRADRVLRESERRYRQLIEQAADGIFVAAPEGNYLLVNRKFCDMLGYTEEELLKLNVVDTYPDEMQGIGRQRIRRVTAGESMRLERPIKRKDGSLLQAELSVSRLDDGRHQGIVHDITERKRVGNELRRLSTAIDQAAEEIMITDPEGVIQYVNPAFENITGFSRAEAVGQTPRILKSGTQGRAFYENLWNTIKDGRIWTGRITNKRKDGRLIQEDGIITPLLNASGETTGYVSLKRDITESVMLEAEFRQAQKMEAIGTLAGGIAHDFNNILAAIMGYVELVKFKTSDAAIQPYLEQVLKASDRAKNLVAQILTFSRKREQEKKPIAVASIVKEAMKLLRASLPATIEIRQSYTVKNDTVLADATQIHQVLINLCTNAVHAMRDHEGVLEIAIEQQDILIGYPSVNPVLKPGLYLKLTVSDSGEGIDPAIQDKIFDPFFTTKKPGEGTGLGLSTVYGIVKDHGGVITVESSPGEGTAFTILLPVIDVADHGEDREHSVIPGGSGRILLVDDEESVASLGREMLTSLGYEVTVKSGSREALDSFQADPAQFDLVVTDMTMPHMTGATLAREILKIRPGIPIVLMTGFSAQIDEEEAERIGIRAFVMKPVPLPILARTVRQIMDEEASRSK